MFLFVGVVMAVLQGGVVRRIPLGQEKKAAMGGLLLIVPSFVIVGSCQSLGQLYIGLGLYAISTAFVRRLSQVQVGHPSGSSASSQPLYHLVINQLLKSFMS